MIRIPVAIALGSNLGDRQGHLQFAIAHLASLLDEMRVSSTRETEPEEVPDPQPPYLNAVVVGTVALEADALLARLLAIEGQRGRERRAPKAARTLDVDLILYGDRVLSASGLTVPHPRFRHRRFVLEPLAELAPDWVDPVTGRTVVRLLEDLGRRVPDGRCATVRDDER